MQRVCFNNFSVKNRNKHFIESKSIVMGFFICMVSYLDTRIAYSLVDMQDVDVAITMHRALPSKQLQNYKIYRDKSLRC